jgi:MinD superfamily P-loop ATPase
MLTDRQPIRIAIASGKGGTGKTLVATNLAAMISLEMPVLLADLDVEEPNASLFMKGTQVDQSDRFKLIPEWDESRCTVCNHCTELCRYNAIIRLGTQIMVFNELCHSCHACSELCPADALPMRHHKIGTISRWQSGNLTFTESRLEIGEEQAVPLIRQTQDYLDDLVGGIPVHVYDCPPGTSCPVVAATSRADFVVLVTEPTPFGLHDLQLAVKTMELLEKPFGVVINRAGIGDQQVENHCLINNIPILARIKYDREIAHHYSGGELQYDKVPHLTDALTELKKSLLINIPQ